MRVCLISPPTAAEFNERVVAESEIVRLFAEHAPVGILSLAAVLDQQGTTPTVVDLNRLYYRYLQSDGVAGEFCSFVASELETLHCDVYGFGTICSSYPLTIRIAQLLKGRCRASRIILGGPQASVVDVETMKAFPFIDFVVRGEAEETLPRLLLALAESKPLNGLTGVTFRHGEAVIQNPAAPVILDLDQLPMPAFHLYPELKDCRYIPLELGRGCPFACSFCSTNDFFRRRFRLKSAVKLIQQMSELKKNYGIEWFDLIHDMFTVDRKRVTAFCYALLEAGTRFYWNCSARTDCVDDDLIALMARAGCRNIFFGIETGSSRMQSLIKKDLDLSEAAARIRCTTRHKITTTVSLITGFPDEQRTDLQNTVAFIMDSLRHDYVKPQLHLLAPLAETPLYSQFRSQLRFDDIISDMSYQGWRQEAADRTLIKSHPAIFPNFYAIPTESLERSYLKELQDFVIQGSVLFRWLLVALHQTSGDLLQVFDAWNAWRKANVAVAAAPVPYYSRPEFVDDFLNFTRGLCSSRPNWWNPAVATLAESTAALSRAANAQPSPSRPRSCSDVIPCLASGVYLAQLPADYKAVLRCLRKGGRLAAIPQRAVTVSTRKSEQNRAELLELTSLSARLLGLCDGVRTEAEIIEQFSWASSSADQNKDIPPQMVCLAGLESLREQGLLV
jgi:radical SAM superfamily enzyme YgiQ (UPF0313 family)